MDKFEAPSQRQAAERPEKNGYRLELVIKHARLDDQVFNRMAKPTTRTQSEHLE